MENLTNQEALKLIEPSIRMSAVNELASSISDSIERRFFRIYQAPDHRKCEGLANAESGVSHLADIKWVEITQIGKPIDNDGKQMFTSMQKILQVCHLPKSQLCFLLQHKRGENHLYIGFRSEEDNEFDPDSFICFVKSVWPGIDLTLYDSIDLGYKASKKKYPQVCAITGIPSMDTAYQDIYPVTIDKLINGLQESADYSYLVFACPIDNSELDEIIWNCRDLEGKAESLKKINISDSISKAIAASDQIGVNDSEAVNETNPIQDIKDACKEVDGKLSEYTKALIGVGIGGAVLAGSATLAGAAVAAVPMVMSAVGLAGFLLPRTTTSHTHGVSSSQTLSVTDTESKTIGSEVINKHIEAVARYLNKHEQRFELGKAIGMWNVSAYLISDSSTTMKAGCAQLESILNGSESIYESVQGHDVSEELYQESPENNGMEKVDRYFNLSLAKFRNPKITIEIENFRHPLEERFMNMSTLLTTKELSYYVNFPTHSVPGIGIVDSLPEFNLAPQHFENSMKLGKLMNGGTISSMDYDLPKDILSRHVLVTGINGSGKTNTIQSLLGNIGAIPFLILEPAKTEYVDWAIQYNENNPDKKQIKIFMPGCNGNYRNTGYPKEKLQINPFQPIWLSPKQDPNVLSHIDLLKTTFAAAFPMYDILPVLLEDLIYAIYQKDSIRWIPELPRYETAKAPTLNAMSVYVDQVIRHRGYEDRVERNMKACLNTRIDCLKRGWRGEMLNVSCSTNPKEIFESPCVINLSYVGDDVDKGFIMALILQQIYEYRIAQAQLGIIDFNDDSCRHLTIIEEAHRVMSRCENPEMPQYKAAMAMSNMLSEIRAYGEGFVLVDQVPTRLIPDAIKNTNTKICHRIVAEDDAKAMAESMALSDEQKKLIPRLLTGQCIVSNSLSTESYWINVHKVK